MVVTWLSLRPRGSASSPRRRTNSSGGRRSCARSTGCCATRAWSRWSARAGSARPASSLRAADAAAARYADGVCLVELSALRDPELLPHTIARRLGLAEQALASQRDALLAHLSDRRLLLILDTCEHLIDAVAELVEAILIAAPQVTVLTSSREPLDVDGETTFPVRPLPVTRPEGTGEEPHPFGVTDFQAGGEPGGGARRPPPATPSSSSRGGRPPPCPGSR